jgi:hypothetical protein
MAVLLLRADAAIATLGASKWLPPLLLLLLLPQALLYEPGTHVVSRGALAASSGAKTGRCPGAKHVLREPAYEGQVWWGEASPNHPMEDR